MRVVLCCRKWWRGEADRYSNRKRDQRLRQGNSYKDLREVSTVQPTSFTRRVVPTPTVACLFWLTQLPPITNLKWLTRVWTRTQTRPSRTMQLAMLETLKTSKLWKFRKTKNKLRPSTLHSKRSLAWEKTCSICTLSKNTSPNHRDLTFWIRRNMDPFLRTCQP